MKHYVLITVGSRGDAEPFCSLAKELIKLPDVRVDLFLQHDALHLAPNTTDGNESLTLHTLPFGTAEFYEYTTSIPAEAVNHPNPRVKFVGIVSEIIGNLVLPCYDSVDAVVNAETTMILASSLARQLALAVAVKHQTPVGLIQLQPLQPLSAFPHYSHSDDCVQALLRIGNNSKGNGDQKQSDEKKQKNLETYWEPERFQHYFLHDKLEIIYKTKVKVGQVPNFESDMKAILLGESDTVHIINAYSNQLVPCISTVKAWNVGPLADCYFRDEDAWASDPSRTDLDKFLKRQHGNNHRRPICVGYGSMPFERTQMILDALQALDRPAVLVGTCFVSALSKQQKNDWIDTNIIAVSSAPYPWLLPQCSMMLSHGGAGVVNAVLRAGVPHVISPLLGDQFFWSELLTAKQLGVAVEGGFNNATVDTIQAAILRAVGDDDDDDSTTIQEAASQLGEQIQNGEKTGVEQLVEKLLGL